MSEPEEREPSDSKRRETSILIYAAIVMLGIVAVAIWYRPCELYRTQIVVQHEEFGWRDTTCAPQPQKGCYCVNVYSYEWTIGEWVDEPQRLDDPDQEVIPKISW